MKKAIITILLLTSAVVCFGDTYTNHQMPKTGYGNRLDIGSLLLPWRHIYGVDGTFSGTITAGEFDFSGSDITTTGTITGGTFTDGTFIVSDGIISVGTWQGDRITVPYGGTDANSLTDGGLLVGSGTSAITALSVLADGEFIVGDGTTDPVAESGNTARTSLELGTGNSPIWTGATLSGLTQGSVLFAGASGVISQDNSNLFWDDTNNRLSVGVNTGLDPRVGISVSGDIDILHTATEADDHAFEMDINAAGYGDVKAIDIDYITGNISAGEDEGVILINIDEIAATGGDVFGIEILATEGSAGIYGMKAGVGIGPVHQDSGTFVNPTTGTDNTPSTDVAAMIDADIGTTTAIFENNSEYIIIGAAAAFEELEIILTTGASGAGIKPTFGYSTAGAGTFTPFTPVDGTNAFRNTGIIAWDAGDLTSHAVNTDTGTYDIKITRTRNSLSTTPILGYAKSATTTEYIWDKDGNVNINGLTLSGNLTIPDGGIIGQAAGPLITFDDTGDDLEISGCNVGIGTVSPNAKLEVYGNGEDTSLWIHEDAGTHKAILRLRSAGNDWELINYGTGERLGIENEGSERVTILQGGNVGIGTTTPTQLLELDHATSTFIEFSRNTVAEGYIGTGAAGQFRISNTGGSGAGIYIDNSDNIGINETNPQEDIHANDTIRADVAFNINGTDGISGTLVLDDGTTERITLVFTGGILTSRTVAATVGLLMDWTD